MSEAPIETAGDEFLLLSSFKDSPVRDIEGYVSTAFGDDIPVFKIFCIHFEDGSTAFVEAEHDMPYIPGDLLPNLPPADEGM